MTENRWRVLVVDDDPKLCEELKDLLEGEQFQNRHVIVVAITNFEDALDTLESSIFDLLILDIRADPRHRRLETSPPGVALEKPILAEVPKPDDQAGIATFKDIRQRRFVPVIFYTGLPEVAREYSTALVRVVAKEGSPKPLLEAIDDLFDTKLPAVNRAIIRHFEAVQRDYMWNFVAEQWGELKKQGDAVSIAYLLARRLAASLSEEGIHTLAVELGGDTSPVAVADCVHPMQFYIIPPVEKNFLAADVFLQVASGDFWVLLTPSCDLVQSPNRKRKAEYAVLARALRLSEQKEAVDWVGSDSKTNTEKVTELVRNNRRGGQPDRFCILPPAISIPGLVVDYQQLNRLPVEELESDRFKRLASLDSPFGEVLLTRFGRYFNRVGCPDLDVNIVLDHLRNDVPPTAPPTPTAEAPSAKGGSSS
jgi:CheY-like chemotaxis protein